MQIRTFSIATKGMLAALAAAVLSASSAQAAGYVGLGIQITKDTQNNTVIIQVMDNGPAFRGGVMPGDIIEAVDGKSMKDKSLDDVTAALHGELGTKVAISLLGSDHKVREIELTREYIELKCLIERTINLRLSGDEKSGTLSGTFDNDYVSFMVFNGRTSGNYKNHSVSLSVEHRMSSQWVLSGYIGSSYVNWNGYDKSWYQGVSCIPE